MRHERPSDPAHAGGAATTSALISRAQDGDRSATEQLFCRFADFARAAVRRRLGHALAAREGVDDLVQSCLADALGSFPSYKKIEGVSVFAWLTTIIIRKLHDKRVFHAALKRMPAGSLIDGSAGETVIAASPAPVDSPSKAAVRNEAVDRLRMALNRFDEEERTLVLARFFLGLEWHEIGEILGCTADSARVRCSRLMPRIRELYGPTPGSANA